MPTTHGGMILSSTAVLPTQCLTAMASAVAGDTDGTATMAGMLAGEDPGATEDGIEAGAAVGITGGITPGAGAVAGITATGMAITMATAMAILPEAVAGVIMAVDSAIIIMDHAIPTPLLEPIPSIAHMIAIPFLPVVEVVDLLA